MFLGGVVPGVLDLAQIRVRDEGGESMQEAALAPPVALVVGNEAKGLSRAAIDMCDLTVRIPMRGSASSLNVASATSIFLYEIDRQRRQATRSIDPA
jgi:TrmH family RNA methyltransferase